MGAWYYFYTPPRRDHDAEATITLESYTYPDGIPIPQGPNVNVSQGGGGGQPTTISVSTSTINVGFGTELIIEQVFQATISVSTDTSIADLVGPLTNAEAEISITTDTEAVSLEVGADLMAQALISVDTGTEAADLTVEIATGVTISVDTETEAADFDLNIAPAEATISVDTETEAADIPGLIRNVSCTISVTTRSNDQEARLVGDFQSVAIISVDTTATDFARLSPPVTCIPVRGRGWLTSVVVQDEEEWGVLSINQQPLLLDVVSESMGNNINFTEDVNVIGQGRAPRKGRMHRHAPGGQLVGELQPAGAWPIIFRHALTDFLPNAGRTDSPLVSTHQLTATNRLPAGLTIEKQFTFPDGTNRYLRYLGCRVNALTVRIPVEGNVRVTADIIAREEQVHFLPLSAAPTIPDETRPFRQNRASLLMEVKEREGLVEGNKLLATSAVLTINNNMRDDQYSIADGRLRTNILPRRRNVSGEVQVFFTAENFGLYQSFLAGTTLDMRWVLFGEAIFPNWVFAFPGGVQLRGSPPTIGRGPLSVRVPFVATDDPLKGRESGAQDFALTVFNGDPVLTTAV